MRRLRLPRYDDGKGYIYDSQTGKWNRYTKDAMGQTFANTTITPNENRQAFNYENRPVKLKMPTIETDQQYTQRRIAEESKPYTFGTNTADLISTAVGFTPAATIESGLNAVNSTIKGDYGNAAMYGVGMIPAGGFFKKVFGGIGKFFSNLFRSKYKRRMLRNRMSEGANDAIYGIGAGSAAAYGADQASDGDETASSLAGAAGFAAGVGGRRILKRAVQNMHNAFPKVTDPLIYPTQTTIETYRGNYPWTNKQQQSIYDNQLNKMENAVDDFFPQRRADSEHALPKTRLNVRGSDGHIYGESGEYDMTDPNNPIIRINNTADARTNLSNEWSTDPEVYSTPQSVAVHEYNHHIQRNNEGLKYTKVKEGYDQDGMYYKNTHAWDENSPVAEEAKILFANGNGWYSSVDEFDSELSRFLYESNLGYTAYPGEEIINRLAQRFDLPVNGVQRLANAIITNRIAQLGKNGVKSLDAVVHK